MVVTWRVGVASASGSAAYATYLQGETLKHEHEAAARYYAGEISPRPAPGAEFSDALTAPVGTVAELRPDLSPAFAGRLGIADPSRPLITGEIASLMNNQRADGGNIEGRKKHSAHRAVAEVFGLDPRTLPSIEMIENVLAGRRADGDAPRAGTGNGERLSAKVVESSLRKFKAAIGVPADRETTADEIARVAMGRIDVAGYLK
ncbi:MAG TPA: hypothetical protein VHN39_11785, partial [Phenylobacterium sp.]|nr:hypothetical protein [Phenylobacterium sp.]